MMPSLSASGCPAAASVWAFGHSQGLGCSSHLACTALTQLHEDISPVMSEGENTARLGIEHYFQGV